jgi:hypothetical protein
MMLSKLFDFSDYPPSLEGRYVIDKKLVGHADAVNVFSGGEGFLASGGMLHIDFWKSKLLTFC